MKRPLLLLLFCLLLYFSSFAQDNSHNIRLVYSSCTQESKQELFELLRKDKVKLMETYKNYNSECKNGKVILSTKQYAPIATRIEKFKSNDKKVNNEEGIYAKIASEKYILVTDLIDK